MSIRRSKSYRRLMTLLNKSGITSRHDRLDWATEILGYEIKSFTELNIDEVMTLLDAVLFWEKTQQIRMNNGVLIEESVLLSRVYEGELYQLGDRVSNLPNNNDRKNQRKEKVIKMSKEKLAPKSLSEIMDTLKNSSSKAKFDIMEAHPGRMPKEEVIPPASTQLGLIMGTGGIPRGKIIHVWGPPHSGKTTYTFNEIAKAQQAGIPCVFIDLEHAFVPEYAEEVGINVAELPVVQPGPLEEASTLMQELADSGALIVIDSVAAGESVHEYQRDLMKGESVKVGGTAQQWKTTLNKLRSQIENGTTYVLLNQVRANLKQMNKYDDEEVPFGTKAIQHNSDISIKVTKKNDQKRKDSGYQMSRFKIDKNRFVPYGAICEVSFKKGFGYDNVIDVITAAGMEASSGLPRGEVADIFYINTSVEENGELKNTNQRYTLKVTPEIREAMLQDNEEQAAKDLEKVVGDYLCTPGRGEGNAIKFLRQYPTVVDIVKEKLLDTLNDDAEWKRETRAEFT